MASLSGGFQHKALAFQPENGPVSGSKRRLNFFLSGLIVIMVADKEFVVILSGLIVIMVADKEFVVI